METKKGDTMNVEKVIETLSNHKGQNLSAVWTRPLKTRKGVEDTIIKTTCAVVRGGVDYDNLQSVKEGRADGTLPEENEGLPWGEWVQFPIHIEHKGQDYIRLYPASGLSFTPQVHYLCNGKLAKKEDIQGLCLSSEFRVNDEKPKCFTLKAEAIITLG